MAHTLLDTSLQESLISEVYTTMNDHGEIRSFLEAEVYLGSTASKLWKDVRFDHRAIDEVQRGLR